MQNTDFNCIKLRIANPRRLGGIYEEFSTISGVEITKKHLTPLSSSGLGIVSTFLTSSLFFSQTKSRKIMLNMKFCSILNYLYFE